MKYNSSKNIPRTKSLNTSYYFKKSLKLPDTFYQEIIELENEIQLSPSPSLDLIRNLGTLYKTAIETFSGVSQQKVDFYTRKLTQLVMITNKINKNKNKKQSNWSKYMKNHKKNTNKFMLFLQVETSKKEANDIMDSKDKTISNGFKETLDSLDLQAKKFEELKKKKKIRKSISLKSNNEENNKISNNNENTINEITSNDKTKGRNDKIDFVLNDFMKKFHYIYLHSKIFEGPIEKLNEILEKVFLHKIDKYYYYQDQIKQFQLMKDDDDEQENNEHDEEIKEYINTLVNERKSYYIVLENLIKTTYDKIKNICEEVQMEEDKNIKKYFDELLISISKIFI